MKQWLRQNPQHLPAGLSASDNTSHELRNGLRNNGWGYQELDDKVLLVKPDEEGNTSFVEELSGKTSETEEHAGILGPGLPFESDLRDLIAHRMQTLELNGRRLALFQGFQGVEYPTEVGRIDILAVDDEENFVVFELKLGKGANRAVGQVSRYMGWVKQHLATGREVYGVVVAKTIDGKLKYAASPNPNIHLFEYRLDICLSEPDIRDLGA